MARKDIRIGQKITTIRFIGTEGNNTCKKSTNYKYKTVEVKATELDRWFGPVDDTQRIFVCQ